MKPLVSVVVPTKNSAEFLEPCLQSIINQTYKHIELIVVDNYSTDTTGVIAKKYTLHVFQKGPERGSQKNYGMRKATGKFILFIDSDMELTPTVVAECVRAITSHKKAGGVIISERSVGTSFWVKVRDFERSFYAKTSIESARFFPLAIAKKVQGFDENIIFYEESTLPQKIKQSGFNVGLRITSEILHHEDHFSLVPWLQKKYYYGKSAYVHARNASDAQKAQTSVVYRVLLFLQHKRFYTKPLYAGGVLLLKSLEGISAIAGYLSAKIKIL